MSDQTEAELLDQARAGDNAAYAALQGKLEPEVRRFIRRLIGWGDLEDDLVQNTFIALYRNLSRIDEIGKLRPFIFRVVRNQCYDELRQNGRYDNTFSLDDMDGAHHERITDPAPSPADTTHWLMLYAEVREAIDQLPELQRQTLLLYTEADMSYAEIAETMRVSIGTVKSRLFHAKQTLARLISEETRAALSESNES